MPGVDKMPGVAQLSGGRLASVLNVAEVVGGPPTAFARSCRTIVITRPNGLHRPHG